LHPAKDKGIEAGTLSMYFQKVILSLSKKSNLLFEHLKHPN